MSQFDTLFPKTQKGKSAPAVQTKGRPQSLAQMPVNLVSVSDKKRRGKSDDKSFRQVLTYLKIDTHKAVKARLIFDDQNRDLSDLVEELLTEWLTRDGNS